jgi:hypothetical protein
MNVSGKSDLIVKNQVSNWIMRIHLLSWLLCVLMVSESVAYRTFTDTQNRTFDGLLQAYNATNQTVTIRRSDGRTGKMPLTLFSEQDRDYIHNWGMTNDFVRALRITVSLDSGRAVDEEGNSVSMGSRNIRDFHYRLELKNPSTSLFERIDVEYCIYYRQGERDGNQILYDEGTCYGKMKVEFLEPGTSQQFDTRRVRLYSEQGSQTLFGLADSLSTADIRGIWLRLRMKLPAGGVIEREYRTSDDDMWKWVQYSIGAGMNQGSGAYQYFIQ